MYLDSSHHGHPAHQRLQRDAKPAPNVEIRHSCPHAQKLGNHVADTKWHR